MAHALLVSGQLDVKLFPASPVNESNKDYFEVADRFHLGPICRAEKAACMEHFTDPEMNRASFRKQFFISSVTLMREAKALFEVPQL